jgi:alkylhydroperoxidase/carboxymuconolactone decarboxylase family protein YurZ
VDLPAPAERTLDDLEAALTAYRPSASRRRQVFAQLDPAFARTWLRHAGRLLARPHLSMRMRFLVFTGQYTMVQNLEALEEVLEGALTTGVDPLELLESILQCYTYAGESRVEAAAAVFTRVATRTGTLEQVRESAEARMAAAPAPLTAAERDAWDPGDRDDPRLPGFLERYGHRGLRTGLRLRPGHVLNLATTLDALDPEFLQVWLDTVHEDMYSRGVLDDATRLMIVIGNCFAIGESHQARRHMRSALRSGASPQDLLELIIQSTATFGHPSLMPLAFDDLISILDELGRLGDLVDTDRIDEVRRITAERVARRQGTQDLPPGQTT